jgi:hypothetical protein
MQITVRCGLQVQSRHSDPGDGDYRAQNKLDAYRTRLKLNVGLKRTRSSDTDRSRRERAAGLEWLFFILGRRWKRQYPCILDFP